MTGASDSLRTAWSAASDQFSQARAGSPQTNCPAPASGSASGGSGAAATPTIPAECDYLNKRGLVDAGKPEFDRIRKPAKIGPERAIKHSFPGDTADVDAISQTVEVDGRSIEVIRPKTAPAGKHSPSVQQIADALGTVPGKQLDSFKRVEISNQPNPDDAYWAQQYNQPGFYSGATGGPDGVTYYPSDSPISPEYIDGTAIHEGGHAYAHHIWADPKVKQAWQDAMTKDGRSVSDYADASIDEDFAETLVTYSLSKGTTCEKTARELFPARYEQLDQLLK